ncbi:hypothetical protein NQ318_015181 [Aromia moschata]|uniref:Uncharacterized protein n=1 Tax=Aromia moschata TaxID=1265417 RepID=A0AAV8XX88_9CUCU|nr:hypothetical protein NQ318_015181 [Aromia moschata]
MPSKNALIRAIPPGGPKWSMYIKGVIANYKGDIPPAFKAVVHSSVPTGEDYPVAQRVVRQTRNTCRYGNLSPLPSTPFTRSDGGDDSCGGEVLPGYLLYLMLPDYTPCGLIIPSKIVGEREEPDRMGLDSK